MRNLSVITTIAVTITTILCASACGSKKVVMLPAPAADAPQTPADATDPPAAPYAMPDVLGIDALEDTNPDPDIVEVNLEAGPAKSSFMAGTTAQVFAYNGKLPGALLKAKVGDQVIVHFKNNLTEETTIHWHGLRISDQMDGSPRVRQPIKPGEEFTYQFKVPDAGTFWYHPHIQAAEQVEKGLYGAIVVFDPKKDPTYDTERYLILDDIRIESDGSISPPSSMDGMMAGRFGNVLLTNGHPTKEAVATAEQGTVERWRIVNSANARTMQIGVDGASFRVIATDGGLLPQPYVTKRISVAVGQRYDLAVTYDQAGTAKLVNYVDSQDDSGKTTTLAIPALTVNVTASDRTPRDIVWPDDITLPDRAPTTAATITLSATQMGDMPWTINGTAMPTAPLFTWPQGATVDLTIVNDVATEHPFHLHGNFFTIDDAKQPGLKDVVLVPPSATVKVRAYVDNPGRWMVHCHILEHAEMGMMGEVIVTPNADAPTIGPTSR